ncbi:MAG: N-6 DNA methylase [Prevotella sp.]|nr:N-6 DNA methylase [Prevotella sp.]
MTSSGRDVKHGGQVFTPPYLVGYMLDLAGYVGREILSRHVIDNSCGEGAFLCEVADRYCAAFTASKSDMNALKGELEQYIHGIEIDRRAAARCRYNLDGVAARYGLNGVNWDVINANALDVKKYDGLMDYVVGNPPYVRVHNLADGYAAVKSYRFAQDGMTDLYLVFFELGFNMLSPLGRLCYITPSSWLSSVAAGNMRRYILRRRTLTALVDLAHFQAFEGITAYTMIALFCNGRRSGGIDYYKYGERSLRGEYVCNVSYDDICIGGNFYLAPRRELEELRGIKTRRAFKYCMVKNGFATLADRVFILGVTFDSLTIPVLKASTGRWHKGFFPYAPDGTPLPEEQIFAYPEIAAYLNAAKRELLKGKDEAACPYWYLYGRTQALRDVCREKYAVNTVIKDKAGIRLTRVAPGGGVYGGLYILTAVPEETLRGVVVSDDFLDYLRMLKKYKSGGYYTYNSLDLEQYINAALARRGIQESHYARNDKRRVSQSGLTLF